MSRKLDIKSMIFERKKVLDFFSIVYPNTFEVMPEEDAQLKYHSSLRPEVILTTSDHTVNLGFSLFQNPQIKSTRETIESIREAFENKQAPRIFRIGDATPLQRVKGSWFDFRTYAGDTVIYNMHLIAIINGVALQSSFNCPFDDFADWRAITIQMWESIKHE